MLLRLAWRNLRRNRRRTALTAAAGVFASMLTLLTLGQAKGMHDAWIDHAIRTYPGHFEVNTPGFRENRTLDYRMALGTAERAALDRVPADWTPRLEGWGLAMADVDDALGRATRIVGVDPGLEKVSRLGDAIRPGAFDAPDKIPSIVLGHTLARNLGVAEEDLVIVMAPDAYGSQSAERFRVADIVEVGNREFDAHTALVELRVLQRFLAVDEGISYVAVFAPTHYGLDPVAAELSAIFPAPRFETLGWKELIPEIEQVVLLDDVGAWVSLGVLIAVVGFGLLNTILMSVFERTREFGVMRALGLRPRAVFALVVYESLMLSTLGIVIGVALGAPIVAWVEAHPIRITGGMEVLATAFELEPMLYADLTWAQVGWVVTWLTFVALLASILPALRASRGRPVDAIRAA